VILSPTPWMEVAEKLNPLAKNLFSDNIALLLPVVISSVDDDIPLVDGVGSNGDGTDGPTAAAAAVTPEAEATFITPNSLSTRRINLCI